VSVGEGGVGFWLAVALGGALGALLRAGLFRVVETLRPASRQLGAIALGPARATLLANTLGCALLGWLSAAPPDSDAGLGRALLALGACGSLTTFSTLCADAIGFLERRERLNASVYLACTIGLGLAAWATGLWLGR